MARTLRSWKVSLELSSAIKSKINGSAMFCVLMSLSSLRIKDRWIPGFCDAESGRVASIYHSDTNDIKPVLIIFHFFNYNILILFNHTPKLPVKIPAQGFGGAPPTIYLDFRGPPMQPEVDRLSPEHGSAVRLSLGEVTRKRLPNIKIFFWKSWVLKKTTEISNNGYWM